MYTVLSNKVTFHKQNFKLLRVNNKKLSQSPTRRTIIRCCQNIDKKDQIKLDSTENDKSSEETDQSLGNIQNGSTPEAEVTLEELPTGELDFKKRSPGQVGATWFRLFFALPWRRFKKESVLTFNLQGEIPDKIVGRLGGSCSVPQICNSLEKAAYDPRIAGIAIKVSFLSCGWGKLQEIRRYFELFKKSGKFTIAYMERGGEKEYYLASVCDELYMPPSADLILRGLAVSGTFVRGVLNKIGVEPQIKRIGKYKSAGDQLLRTDMADAQREQLTLILDDIFEDFVADICTARNKPAEEFQDLLDEGVFKMDTFKERGWVNDLLYEDQVKELLEKRTGGKDDQVRKVSLKKYAWVSPSAFGLNGKKCIAVMRTSGAIVGSEMGTQGSITAKDVIGQLRQLEKNKKIAAIVLRIDSPGGDALASDLMWREIKRIDEKKPVVASMGDVAASGGYYMAMAARKIVAEKLTITGSIGVVAAKFNLQELYGKIGYKKEVIPRGKFAEVLQEYRGFTESEQEFFDRSVEYAYEEFRNKAAMSRGMTPEKMQELAQGRVWSGKQAIQKQLVDAVGGINLAVQIAKQFAEIPEEDRVTVLEISRQKFQLQQVLAGGAVLGLEFLGQMTGQNNFFNVLASLVQIASQDSGDVMIELQALMSSSVLCLAENVDVVGVSSIVRNSRIFQADSEWEI